MAKKDRDAANFVDWRASSQDIIDTCRVLQLRQALDLIARDLQSIAEPLVALAEKHRLTFIAGRTWMKHALPTTLGLQDRRVARRVIRHHLRLAETQNLFVVFYVLPNSIWWITVRIDRYIYPSTADPRTVLGPRLPEPSGLIERGVSPQF